MAQQFSNAAEVGARPKAPRTARGERTLRKILDAAMNEFGERGFNEASIVGITSRAKVALGTFYTYFDSKEEVFRALVRDMSEQVRTTVAPLLSGDGDSIERERLALMALLQLIASRKQVYRIIDEAEFVDPAGYERHYTSAAERIANRLREAAAKGEVEPEEDGAAVTVTASTPLEDATVLWLDGHARGGEQSFTGWGFAFRAETTTLKPAAPFTSHAAH